MTRLSIGTASCTKESADEVRATWERLADLNAQRRRQVVRATPDNMPAGVGFRRAPKPKAP